MDDLTRHNQLFTWMCLCGCLLVCEGLGKVMWDVKNGTIDESEVVMNEIGMLGWSIEVVVETLKSACWCG